MRQGHGHAQAGLLPGAFQLPAVGHQAAIEAAASLHGDEMHRVGARGNQHGQVADPLLGHVEGSKILAAAEPYQAKYHIQLAARKLQWAFPEPFERIIGGARRALARQRQG